MTRFAEGIEDEARLLQPRAVFYSFPGFGGTAPVEEYECSACGNTADWISCESCTEGMRGHACGEDTCACVNPQDNVQCDVCDGDGGWHACGKCGVLAPEISVVERPILFSGPMVRAILDGRKTQTRRVVKPQPEQRGTCGPSLDGVPAWYWTSPRYDNGDGVHYFHTDEEAARRLMVKACPYGQPGDRLWVRETWSADFEWPNEDGFEIRPWEKMPAAFRSAQAASSVYYAADHIECHPPTEGLCAIPYKEQPTAAEWAALRWKPSIHMPRWASRFMLEITGVHVEPLQEITAADVQAEGWRSSTPESLVPAFAVTWDSLNSKRGCGWDLNPWVWVIEFKQVTYG